MDWVDLSYYAGVSLAGGLARALDRGLPESWRLRLDATPPDDLDPGWIWLHAVSVGELVLAEGVLARLREKGYRVHVTTGTQAGLGLLEKRLTVWNRQGEPVTGGAFPVDDPVGLRPFLDARPGAFVALETELWPNLLRELEVRGIPRIVVNGRLTERTLDQGGPWLRRAASRLNAVAARDEASAEAFRRQGAPRVELGGNLKADLPLPAPLHEGWDMLRKAWTGCPVLVAGNTVDGEEALVLGIWQEARRDYPELRLILAPRQPRRFQEVALQFQKAGLVFQRASQPWSPDSRDWEVSSALLLDTLGELPSAYGEGTLALVGGGWTWTGGHNPMEPVRWGLPTLIGPGFANFEDLVNPLRDAGLLEVIAGDQLQEALSRLLRSVPLRSDPAKPPQLPAALGGALDRTCKVLWEILPAVR
jgi:3-deoxy-D-manno-octulosonic-acid transferase